MTVVTIRRGLKSRLLRHRTLLVWLAALSAALVLYARRESGIYVVGYAAEIRYELTATSAGRLDDLYVSRNQEVTRGQLVASLNPEALLLELQEARLELRRIAGELGRETELLSSDASGERLARQTDLRRFARDVESAHVDFLEKLADLAEDRIELQGLELALERTRRLHAEELTSGEQFDVDRIACEALRAGVAERSDLVEILARRYANALARRDTLLDSQAARPPELAALLEPLEFAVDVQEVRIEKVNMALAGMQVRSPADGVVADVLRNPGEWVDAGQTIVSIVEQRSREVVAFLPEERCLDVTPGDEVQVRRIARRGRRLQVRVASLDAGLRLLPDRFQTANGPSLWGRAVCIPLPDDLAVKPGESFEVLF